MKIEIQKEWYTPEKCKNNPDKVYIFGDNIQRIGLGGQAKIRNITNSYGIATKVAPGMDPKDFFNDNNPVHLKTMLNDIKVLCDWAKANKFTIVFPYDGLGTGLSDLPNKAPNTYNALCKALKDNFEVNTSPEGKLFKI